MTAGLIKMAVTILAQMLDFFLKKSQLSAEGKKKYDEFMLEKQKSQSARVANLIASERALREKQAEIRARLAAKKAELTEEVEKKTEVREDGFKWEK